MLKSRDGTSAGFNGVALVRELYRCSLSLEPQRKNCVVFSPRRLNRLWLVCRPERVTHTHTHAHAHTHTHTYNHTCTHTREQRKQRHSLKLGKKRWESSKPNYYIISPRVIVKAIIIIIHVRMPKKCLKVVTSSMPYRLLIQTPPKLCISTEKPHVSGKSALHISRAFLIRVINLILVIIFTCMMRNKVMIYWSIWNR